MTKERIEIIRQTLIPFVKKELLEINYEDLGKSDAKEFEKDLNEVLDLAIKALEQPSGVEDLLKQVCKQERWLSAAGYNAYNVDIAFKSIYTSLTHYTPTHGTCKNCLNHGINKQHENIDGARYCSSFHSYTGSDFFCADFEKRDKEEV